MALKEEIDKVIDAIFILKDPAIDSSRREKIRGFVETTINGDSVKTQLAINANLSKELRGALVYVLTNRRLVKFDIDPQDIKSVSHPLNTITGIERTLEGDRAGIRVIFQNGTFGLKYADSNETIKQFFQEVDQSRAGDEC